MIDSYSIAYCSCFFTPLTSTSRVAVPAEGSRIQVVGPWVADTQHGWNEIHPAWWVSAGRIQPASPTELRRAQLLLQTGASDTR